MSAEREAQFLAEVQSTLEDAVAAGVFRVRITDEEVSGTSIRVAGRNLINFGSCSYLGLGQDDRLKSAAMSAVQRFGPSYSSSIAYASVDLYTDLEAGLSKLFGGYFVIPAPTTTLGHLAAIPVLVGRRDTVIMDIQAHASLHLAADVLRGRGVAVKLVRHNDMNALRSAIRTLAPDHEKIWYFADGIYSMHGDVAPIAEIQELMSEFPSLHVYYDDAHGFGWAGNQGVGYVLDNLVLTERIFLAVSLSKSFGAGGGAIVCANETDAQRILLMGGTLAFGGPIHPAVLGAGIASAALHLSPEHEDRQGRLYERIDLVNQLVLECGLPVPSVARTPISFVRIGMSDQVIRMAKILMANGFFVNPAAYPAVPRRQGGIRFTVTADHHLADIKAFLFTIAEYMAVPDEIDLTSGSDARFLDVTAMTS